MTKMLDEALHYAIDLGWPVFPCGGDDGKKPLTPHGFKDAVTEENRVEQYWTEHPHANIGAPCQSFWVLDVDGEAGAESLRKLQGDRPIYTAVSRTGRGKHLFFKGQGPRSCVGVFPGIDIRAIGSYVILPPSRHYTGVDYRWDIPIDEMEEAPEWLSEALGRPIPDSSSSSDTMRGVHSRKDDPSSVFNERQLSKTEKDVLASALEAIPADDYETWIRIGMALHSTHAYGDGWALWLRWSQKSSSYKDVDDCLTHWRSFGRRETEVTIATLYREAKDRGWTAPPAAQEEKPAEGGGINSPISLWDWSSTGFDTIENPIKYLLRTRATEQEKARAFMARGKTAILAAEGGAGKTTNLMALAACVATGRDWLDHFEVQKGPTKVAVLLGEDSQEEALLKLRRYAEVAGLEAWEIEEVRANVRVFGLESHLCPLVRWNSRANMIEWTEHFEALCFRLAANDEEWGLVIIDPLSRFTAGGVEMDNERATQMWQIFEKICKHIKGNPAVLVAGHTDKLSRREGQAYLRGVTAQTDGARLVMTMVNKPKDHVTLGIQKSNFSKGWWDLILGYQKYGLLVAKTLQEVADASAEDQEHIELWELADRIYDRALALTEPVSKETLANMIKGGIQRKRAAVEIATSRGLLQVVRRGKREVYYAVRDVRN